MKLFSDYVSPDVLDKVIIEKERSIPKTFWREVAVGQLNVRYGGTMDEGINFWPPLFPIGDVMTPILITDNIEDLSEIIGASERDYESH